MAVLPTGIGPVTGGYQIERSLRFNSADSAYLNRTPASATNRKTFTWSGWVKRGALSSSASYFLFAAGSFAGSTNTSIRILNDSINIYWGGTGGPQWTATAVLRDPSAWYHLVFAFDTTQATFGNRLKLYVNGVQSTVWSLQETGGLTAQNSDLYINNNQQHNLGASGTPGNYFDGYLTEINFIDGQALTPSDFGETDANTGVWKPKAYSGTYGTNGFYLKFADNSGTTSTTLGKDSSGNGNNWTPNNFSVTAGAGNDSLVDSPTSYGTDTGAGGEVRGNYATFNPLFRHPSTTYIAAYSEGNLKSSATSGAETGSIASIGPTSGKWYAEFTCAAIGTNNAQVSVAASQSPDQMQTSGEYLPGNYSYGIYYLSVGTRRTNNTATASWGSSWTTNDVIGVAIDCDTGKIWFAKNGTWQASGNPAAGTNEAVDFAVSAGTPFWFGVGTNNSAAMVANFGQRPFAYTAPSGFKALCTQNLPTPTIGATSTTQANDYFDATVYTGTGSALTVTNSGMQPDWVWIKNRTSADSSGLWDAIRGVNQRLISNLTNAEDTSSGVSAFNSNGFSVGTAANYNTNGNSFIAWQWNAGGSTVTNTSGTISAQVRANTTSGFSIVTYTGTGANATVGHGIGTAPSMIFVKGRSGSGSGNSWRVYHSGANASPASGALYLNSTSAFTTDATAWNSTAPTSNVFSLGTDAGVNSTGTYVAYCFAPVAGYSAFGSYTGNGSTDGPFIFTNFRPRFVIRKCSGATGNWFINDAARDSSNVVLLRLNADLSDAESSGANSDIDFLSNGFKIRATSTAGVNQSGQTHIYMAFAENPFKYSLAR